MTPVVALDCFDVRTRAKGVSRALQNIAIQLTSSPRDIDYVVLTTAEGASQLREVPSGSVRIVPDTLGALWEQVWLPWAARRVRADLVYTQRECPPLAWGRTVVHIHEDPFARFARQPPSRPRERARVAYQHAVMARGLRKARAILASSSATASAIAYLAPRRPITVVPLGVDEHFFRSTRVAAEPPYLFHLGSPDPRDNTVLVVQSYLVLKARRPGTPRLVVAGALGNLEASLRTLAPEGSVQFTGWVSDCELAAWYAGATICVQPSEVEGFGLQPLEALAAGAPLLALDTEAVREVVGDLACFVPTASAGALAAALGRLLDDEPRRTRLRETGPQRARAFGWDRTAAALEDVFRKTLGI